MQIVEQSVKLLSHTEAPERLIEYAGRQCYHSRDKIEAGSAEKFCGSLLKNGHTSVLEFGNAVFDCVIDRGILGEVTRHRVGFSFAVQSSRYCDYSSLKKFSHNISFIRPSEIKEGSFEDQIWKSNCENCEKAYFNLIRQGVKPENARSVLPMCLATPLTIGANFRAWLHFLELRESPKAHPDIRILAKLIHKELKKICPSIF